MRWQVGLEGWATHVCTIYGQVRLEPHRWLAHHDRVLIIVGVIGRFDLAIHVVTLKRGKNRCRVARVHEECDKKDGGVASVACPTKLIRK